MLGTFDYRKRRKINDSSSTSEHFEDLKNFNSQNNPLYSGHRHQNNGSLWPSTSVRPWNASLLNHFYRPHVLLQAAVMMFVAPFVRWLFVTVAENYRELLKRRYKEHLVSNIQFGKFCSLSLFWNKNLIHQWLISLKYSNYGVYPFIYYFLMF